VAAEALAGFVEGSSYRILHCLGCGSALANPLRFDPAVYRAIYGQAEAVPGYSRYAHYAEAILRQRSPLAYLSTREECYWAIATTLETLFPDRQAALLEVGCGLGYLTYALTRAGYRRVLGVDLTDTAVAQAQERYGCDYMTADIGGFAAQTGERFDALVLSEVIEHLEDPLGLLHNACALLKPGGYLLCTTPNRSFGGHPQQLWATDLPPVHLWWFTEQGLRVMAQRIGATVEFVDFSPWYCRRQRRFDKAWERSLRNALPPAPLLDAGGRPRQRNHRYRSRPHRLRALTERLQHGVHRLLGRPDPLCWQSSNTLCAVLRMPG
jgi:SAM-dependent methyltransferase